MNFVLLIVEMQLRVIGRIMLGCFAALFAVTSTFNAYASVRCVEEGKSVKMELICNPCCGTDDVECSSDIGLDADSDHIGCDNCRDFPAEELTRPSRFSTKFINEILNATSSSAIPAHDASLDLTGGYSLVPFVNRGHPESVYASLKSTILQC